MEVVQHLKASVLAAPVAAYFTLPGFEPLSFLATTALGVMAGVLIDLDHFPVYRIESGSWEHVWRAMENPGSTATDNENTLMRFEPWKKYVVHAISMPLAAATVYFAYDPAFEAVTLLLLLHLGMDLFHSYREKELFF